MATVGPNRSCGECNACCVVLSVSGVPKPACTPCPKLEDGRCGIYAERPPECAVFECEWLHDSSGVTTEADRPDRSGLMLVGAGRKGKLFQRTGIHLLGVFEVEKGAFSTSRGQELISRLASANPLGLMPWGHTKDPEIFAGPPDVVDQVVAFRSEVMNGLRD